MEALVSGFPTKLQALQFEWAWQNPHASRLLRSAPKADSAAPQGGLARGRGKGKDKEREDGGGDGEMGKVKVKDKLTAADKPPAAAAAVAQFPRGALSNRPLSKIQVLQYMLTSAPWRSFPLRVTLLSLDAQAWWDAARRLGPVLRTEAGVRKWEREREREGDGAEDAWGERAQRLDEVRVVLRREGVDGARLVRAGEKAEGEEVERLRVDDGASLRTFPSSSASGFLTWQRVCAPPLHQASSSTRTGPSGPPSRTTPQRSRTPRATCVASRSIPPCVSPPVSPRHRPPD